MLSQEQKQILDELPFRPVATLTVDQTILLNADYRPMGVINWRRAIRLVMKGKAEVLKYSEKVIHTVSRTITFLVPKLIRLLKFVRMLYRQRVPFNKRNVFIRDGFTCCYCGVKHPRLSLDHVTPRSKGGQSTFENVVTACFPCNNKKDNRTPEKAGMFLKKRPFAPTIHEFMLIQIQRLGLDGVLKEYGLI
jgi:5-methylcytosine-specific restriction endonuclease McrA